MPLLQTKKRKLFSDNHLVLAWLLSVSATHALYQPTESEATITLDVLARYILGIPGALVATWAMILERRTFQERGMVMASRAILWAAVALGLYGVVGQLFPRPSYLFSANIINAELFQRLFGIPIQLFRAVMAGMVTVSMIRTLRAFEVERQQRLLAAQEARLAAQQQAMETQQRAQAETEALYRQLQARDTLRQQLLHQVVTAQEKERQRVGRELHDGPGQTLTALELGMAALGESVKTDSILAARQAAELKTLNAQALQELHEVIADLRPSVLDNLGLAPALRGQVQAFEARTGVKTQLVIDGQRRPMDPEMETVSFRIAQEALTNVAKHAAAHHVQGSISVLGKTRRPPADLTTATAPAPPNPAARFPPPLPTLPKQPVQPPVLYSIHVHPSSPIPHPSSFIPHPSSLTPSLAPEKATHSPGLLFPTLTPGHPNPTSSLSEKPGFYC